MGISYVVTQVTLSASLRLDSLRSLGSALAGRDPRGVEGSAAAPLELPSKNGKNGKNGENRENRKDSGNSGPRDLRRLDRWRTAF
jgi:hypothetical protein